MISNQKVNKGQVTLQVNQFWIKSHSIPLEVFTALVEHLYTGGTFFSPTVLHSLSPLADKLNLPHLKEMCSRKELNDFKTITPDPSLSTGFTFCSYGSDIFCCSIQDCYQ